MTRHETAIIGGGPAGAAAATLLARKGHDVLLLEKSRSAHDKVCGEFISWEAVHYLTRLGIDLPALGAHRIIRVRLVNGNTVFESALPFTAWSLSRRLLDEALLTLAAQSGANVQRGSAVRTLLRTGEHWSLTTADTSYKAQSVFLATGKHELQGWARKQHGTNDSIGFKMHLRLPPEIRTRMQGTVEVYLFDEGYAGLEPVENDVFNLCLLVEKNIYTETCKKNWSVFLEWLGNRSSCLGTSLEGASALWQNPLAIYAVPYGYLYRPGNQEESLFRIGDQIAVIPSFAGDGMAIALHSAQLATRTYHAGEHPIEYYTSARRAFSSPLRMAGWMTALLSHETGRRLLFTLAGRWSGFANLVIQQTRLAQYGILKNP